VPWAIGDLPPEAAGRGPLEMAAAYALLAGLLLAWSAWHAIPTTEPPGDRHSSP
jgi:hypothetical protein